MLKPCNHVAGKSLLPPAALERSDSTWAHVAGESCPGPGGLGFLLTFAALSGGFYLSAGEAGCPCRNWMGELSLEPCLWRCTACWLGKAGLRCANLPDKLCCRRGVGRRCWSCSCTRGSLACPGKGSSCPRDTAGAPGMLLSILFQAACVTMVAEAGMRGQGEGDG